MKRSRIFVAIHALVKWLLAPIWLPPFALLLLANQIDHWIAEAQGEKRIPLGIWPEEGD